jgi:putative redox protein
VTETRTLTFAGARGDRLAGRLDLPDGKPRAVVLVAHCFSGGNAGLAAAQIARSFNELSMAVLSLDFAPARHADSKLASATFSLGADDLAIAAAQLRSTMAAPSILVGHSLGGAAVLAIADQVPEAVAVVTLAAPADAAQVDGLGQLGVQAHRFWISPGAARFIARCIPRCSSQRPRAFGIGRAAKTIFAFLRQPGRGFG